MTYQEERFVHFVSCCENLNYAWGVIQEIKNHKDNSTFVGAAFQFALIVYSKPYKYSEGTLPDPKNKKKNCKYKLDEKYIPSDHLDLHNKIIKARDKIHAHSDLTVMDAKIYVEDTQHGKIASIGQNIIYGTEELSNIDTIIDLIEQTLENMYVESKRLEQELPANS